MSASNPIFTAQSQVIYTFSTLNTTSAQLASNATFTGTIEPIPNQQNLSVLMVSDQPMTVTIQQFIDAGGTQSAGNIVYSTSAGVPVNRAWLINGNYMNITAKNTGASTTTTFSLNVAFSPLPLAVSPAGNQAVDVIEGPAASVYGPSQVFVSASSGNQANASAVATIPAVTGRTNYLTGLDITATGATAGSVVLATITGVLGGTRTMVFAAPTGALLTASPLVLSFPGPLQASAANTAIVVTLPALGAGNTNAAVNAQGFYQ
jgi:hypothetical protein